MADFKFYDGGWYGTSTDTKPTGINQSGVPLLETDTGKLYVWDENANDWQEVGEDA